MGSYTSKGHPRVVRMFSPEDNASLEVRGKRISPKLKSKSDKHSPSRESGRSGNAKNKAKGSTGKGESRELSNNNDHVISDRPNVYPGCLDEVSSSAEERSGAAFRPTPGAERRSADVTAATDGTAAADVELNDVMNLPPIESAEATNIAALRLRSIIARFERERTRGPRIHKSLIANLQYAASVLETAYVNETKRLNETDDEDLISEVHEAVVPSQVKDWLSLTFTRSASSLRRMEQNKPKFRSVANVIRAGIMVNRIYRRLSSGIGIHVPPDVLNQLKNLDEWTFDVFAVNESAENNALKYVAYEILQKHELIQKFRINSQALENFLLQLQSGYGKYSNPYHNQIHAADVTQTTHHVITKSGLSQIWMTDIEILATLLAAMVHDFEHTGTTNNFHINTGSELALLYNDRAVLESHHASAAFRLMRQDDCNILASLKKDEYKELRALMIEIVLATDMSFHFSQIKTMRSLLTLPDSVDRCKTMSLIVHCADISHPAKAWHLHSHWTNMLVEEFFVQGDRESEMSLSISPLCDRKNTHIAQSQIGFIDFIVDPSFQVMSDAIDKILTPVNSSDSPINAPVQITLKQELPDSKLKVTRHWADCLSNNKLVWKQKAMEDEERAKLEADNTTVPSEPSADTTAPSNVNSSNAQETENRNKEAEILSRSTNGEPDPTGTSGETAKRVSENQELVDSGANHEDPTNEASTLQEKVDEEVVVSSSLSSFGSILRSD